MEMTMVGKKGHMEGVMAKERTLAKSLQVKGRR